MEPFKAVVRYTNGKMIKGLSYDFFPNKDRFHVIPVDNRAVETIEIIVNHLKGVLWFGILVGMQNTRNRGPIRKVILLMVYRWR